MIRPLVVVFGTLCLAIPSVALAKPKVIVVKIDGDATGDVFTAVTEALDPDLALVSQKEVNKEVDKLNLSDDLSDKEVGKLEKALGAQALIRGSLDKKGENMALHLKVYLKGETGKPKAFTVKFSNADSKKFRKSLHDTILDKIGTADDAAPAAGGGDDDPPAKPTKKKKKKGDEEAAAGGGDDDPPAKPTKKKKKKGDDEAAAGGDDGAAGGDDGDPPAKPKKKKKKVAVGGDDEGGDVEATAGGDDEIVAVAQPSRMSNRFAIRVDAGVSVTGRTLSFATRQYDQAPHTFKNNPVPGAHVEGEIFPFAFANPKSPAAGIGLSFDYDKTLALTLRTTAADGTVVSAPANQQRYTVSAVYRIPFGSSVTSPTLELGVGYGVRTFIVSRGALMDANSIDIPDVNYTAVMPKATIRIPFTANIALAGGVDAQLVTDAGAIEKQDQYGQGKVTGVEAFAGLDIVISNRFVIRLDGTLTAYGFAFVGNGAMAINRDGDPTTKDVGGASDRYFGGAATFGVLY